MSLTTIDFPNSVTGIRIDVVFNSDQTAAFSAGNPLDIINLDLAAGIPDLPPTAQGNVELLEIISDNGTTGFGVLRLKDLTTFNNVFWFSPGHQHQFDEGNGDNPNIALSVPDSATSGIMCDYPYMWTYNDKTQMWRYDCDAGAWVSSGFSLIGGGVGAQGDQGDQGDQGNQGPTGVQGSTGVQGETGPIGDQGETGDQGEIGPTGVQGFQGPTGDQGSDGEDGTSVRFIGSIDNGSLTSGTETGAANGILNDAAQEIINPKVDIFGELREGDGIVNLFDGNLWIAVTVEEPDPSEGVSGDWRNIGNIVGPQGFQGNQGNQGPTGVQGSTGVQGETGPIGDQGETGADGTPGTPGGTGPTGPTGAISTINVNGTQYSNSQVLSFFSDHSITSSFPSNQLTITFGSFMAMITGDNHTKESNIARWQYVMQPSSFNGSNWSVSGSTFTARNLMESGNGTTQAYGISVVGGAGVTLDGPGFSGFSVRRVPTGFSFEVIQKNGFFFFSAANPIDGDC